MKLRDSHTKINLKQLKETIALFSGGKAKSDKPNSARFTSRRLTSQNETFYYKCDSIVTSLIVA